MSDPLHEAGFDHPCRRTCSGWKQGYERGLSDLKDTPGGKKLYSQLQLITELRKQIEDYTEALTRISKGQAGVFNMGICQKVLEKHKGIK